MAKYYCILDFEATCWEDMNSHGHFHEIIEFPSILWKLHQGDGTFEPVSEFRQFVKPAVCPQLSTFCTKLTGITQDQVDHGLSLSEALKSHQKWLSQYENNFSNIVVITVGDWDFSKCLRDEAIRLKIKLPSLYKRWINIKTEFVTHYDYNGGLGLLRMLTYLNIEPEGRLHSGIDDCKNTCSIVKKNV